MEAKFKRIQHLRERQKRLEAVNHQIMLRLEHIKEQSEKTPFLQRQLRKQLQDLSYRNSPL